MNFEDGLDWEEAWDYQPGFTVELKAEPGKLHVIESYDPMMVPPVWLADDPRPRYPHELKLISAQSQYVCPLVVSPVAKSLRSAVVA
ncbi:MAG: hypothetical protein ACKO7W_09565 [Elainella sp.]